MRAYLNVLKTADLTQYNGENPELFFEVIRTNGATPDNMTLLPDGIEFTEHLNCLDIAVSDGKVVSIEKNQDRLDIYENNKQAEISLRNAEVAAYKVRVDRAREYIKVYSKAPDPNGLDAIGHILDAILTWINTFEVTPELQDILDKRKVIKDNHPL